MSDTMLFPAVELPLLDRADVVVCGAGVAGVAAAIAAARDGADTVLLERSGCPGGMTTVGLLPSIISMTDGHRVLAGSICRELVDAVAADMNEPVNYRWQNIHPESVKRVCDRLLEAAGVRCYYDTTMASTRVENRRIVALACTSPAGQAAFAGKIFIDATGDGVLALAAGAGFECGDADGQVMAPTLCSMFDGIDYSASQAGSVFGRHEWARALAEGINPLPERHFVGFFRTGSSCGTGNLGHIYSTNVVDWRSRSLAMVEGRRQAVIFRDFFRRNVPGFENAELIATAGMLGVRESRRINGDYRLCAEDYLRRRHFPDDIGSFAYPIDIHAAGSCGEEQARVEENLEKSRYRPGENYGIPYRVLTVAKFDNLLVAGRCVSTDRWMQSSLRVVPGCMITGEAAGSAAALAVASGKELRGIDINLLRQRLSSRGQYIPC